MAPLHYDLSRSHAPPTAEPRILDIRTQKLALSLEDEIIKGLSGPGEKWLPTLLLYSAQGLKLFEDITYLEEYYLTNTEIEILEKNAEEMAHRVQDGSVVLELGSGNLRKVNIFLKALDRQGKSIDYYALDLDLSELKRTLRLADGLKNVRYNGLHGTYEDGRAWLENTPEVKDRPRCVLWLGSSAGNFERSEAAQFLKDFASDALRAGGPDYMLVGLDGSKDSEKVWTAYNDPHGCTEKFILNGLESANDILGGNFFEREDWEYVGEWNAEVGRHQAYYVPNRDVTFGGKLQGVTVKSGERVNIEYSYKFDGRDSRLLWQEAGLVEGTQWANERGDYCLHMVQKPAFSFATEPADYAPEPVPTVAEWKELWKAWEMVTLGMIPKDQLLSKPIDLRNPCIFYLGHIPTFMDNLLIRATSGKPTEPRYFLDIFQRGIDPDVDDPEQCHDHSQIPDAWPELDEILTYQEEVRQRVQGLYRKGSAMHQPRDVQRVLWTGFEHEAMHLETLLYMLIQSDTTLPPPGVIVPDFASGKTWERRKDADTDDDDDNPWTTIPSTTLDIGLDDPEYPEDPAPHYFGWDNEKPVQKHVTVAPFQARAYPITNEEYATYLSTTAVTTTAATTTTTTTTAIDSLVPASWTCADTSNILATTTVKTVFGAIPLSQALDWPANASYTQLEHCARHHLGARIPTAPELHAIFHHAAPPPPIENKLSKRISAVNGHLVHNGVCESPPPSLFASLGGGANTPNTANTAFRNWHPTPVRASNKLLGRAEAGGAWEWTATVLERPDPARGWREARWYPEYTADFFDGKHNVVLGGSWATHPRIAGRRSFVNWYQRNYRYAWTTARIVRDV